MKKCYLKKFMAIILSVVMLYSAVVIDISAQTDTDSSSIEITEDGETILNLYFSETYYAWTEGVEQEYNSGSPSDCFIKGRAFALTNEAISNYNNSNSDNAISLSDITSVNVSTAKNAFLTFSFIKFIEEKLPQIKVLDMKSSNFTSQNSSANESGENTMPNRYFSGGTDTAPLYLTQIEKIILPDTLKTANFGVFARLSELKNVELGDSLTTVGDSLFLECNSLESVSFHGSAESSADKSAFFTSLSNQIIASSATAIDLSGSDIDTANAFNIANKAMIKYINLKDCSNIEFESETGKALFCRLVNLKALGIEVIMPINVGIITDSDDGLILNLYLVNSLSNNGSKAPYEDIRDIRGNTFDITQKALNAYNKANEASYTVADIKALKVNTSKNLYVSELLGDFIDEKLFCVNKIDLSGTSIDNNTLLRIISVSGINEFNLNKCENISWSLEQGDALYTKICNLVDSGVKVILSEILGDANGDGAFDLKDIVHIKKYVAQSIRNTLNDKSFADYNSDGNINSVDVAAVRSAIIEGMTLSEYKEKMRNKYNLFFKQ